MSGKRDIDEVSGVDTTGHEWDGIKELNNPLPRWWLWTLYGTIAWAIAYVVFYPALPGFTGPSKGIWNWSSRADIRTELAAVVEKQKAMVDRIATMDIAAIQAAPEVRAFAVSAGASAFKVNCSQCHGSGAQGGPGFPNLNDDSWLWGGKPDQIIATIAHGIRDPGDAETRDSLMPNFGKDGILEPAKVSEAVNFVRKLANLEHDAVAAVAGATVYGENCATCHGEKGEGNQDLGAPQLNDAIWFYGDAPEQIAAQVNLPRHGMMPAWQGRLGDTKVKQLAAYVLSLGGGQ